MRRFLKYYSLKHRPYKKTDYDYNLISSVQKVILVNFVKWLNIKRWVNDYIINPTIFLIKIVVCRSEICAKFCWEFVKISTKLYESEIQRIIFSNYLYHVRSTWVCWIFHLRTFWTHSYMLGWLKYDPIKKEWKSKFIICK